MTTLKTSLQERRPAGNTNHKHSPFLGIDEKTIREREDEKGGSSNTHKPISKKGEGSRGDLTDGRHGVIRGYNRSSTRSETI